MALAPAPTFVVRAVEEATILDNGDLVLVVIRIETAGGEEVRAHMILPHLVLEQCADEYRKMTVLARQAREQANTVSKDRAATEAIVAAPIKSFQFLPDLLNGGAVLRFRHADEFLTNLHMDEATLKHLAHLIVEAAQAKSSPV